VLATALSAYGAKHRLLNSQTGREANPFNKAAVGVLVVGVNHAIHLPREQRGPFLKDFC
jgi:hypothetical protein